MSAVVSASTDLTLAIITAYVGMGGVRKSLAGYGAGCPASFFGYHSPGIGGPVGIVISANLGAGRIDRAVTASWVGVLMACTLTELIGLAAAAFHRSNGSEYSAGIPSVLPGRRRVFAPRRAVFRDSLGSAMFFIALDRQQTNGSLRPRRSAKGRHRGARGGYVVVWLKADVTWNFVAVALGMVAFGLFALPSLISRSGYE